jgi:UDP-glucose 4-epimerase
VLVLGGTGFVGSGLARSFRASGWAVRTAARRIPDSAPVVAHTEHVLGSVEDSTFLHSAMQDVDWVVHAVGCPPPAASTDDFDSSPMSVLGLDPLLESLRERPGVGLTFMSSGGAVYGDVAHLPVGEDTRCRPISAYGLAKLMAEDSIAAYSARYDIPARILRVSNAYGPGQDASNGQGVIAALLQAASTGDPVPVFDGGRAVRDFVHIDDVARAVVALRPNGGDLQVVNVGSGIGHPVTQILEMVERLTGADVNVRWLPRRPWDVHSIVLDVTRLRGMMPWHPRGLEEGIARTWERFSGAAEISSGRLSA